MLAQLTDENRARLLSNIPLGRTAQPEEIADVVYWVSQSTFLTGAVIPVTGGEGFGA
jgi:3-oxoacyl-[acyl-carrier protein] reductase